MLVWLLQSVDTIIQLVDALKTPYSVGSFMALLKTFDRSGGALAAASSKTRGRIHLLGLILHSKEIKLEYGERLMTNIYHRKNINILICPTPPGQMLL